MPGDALELEVYLTCVQGLGSRVEGPGSFFCLS